MSLPKWLPNTEREKRIDKSPLTLPELRRVRDRDHVRYAAKQPSLAAEEAPQTLATNALRNLPLAGGKWAMSSRFLYVGGIIARFTAAAMKRPGGVRP